jgi:hypothetical protein
LGQIRLLHLYIIKQQQMKKGISILMMTMVFTVGTAQTESESKNQFSILFGLNQPILLRGFNVEGNYWMKNWVIDYSHGFNLHLDGAFVNKELERQNIDLLVPHTLGLGIGYRFTKGFNLRFEPKLHLFRVYYKGEAQNASNQIEKYSTVTLGAGAYYRWMPFEKKDNFLKGITIAPSLRFWPNVSSSLKSDQFQYSNKITGQTETHKAVNIGAANTPWIVNVSVGYTF